MTGMSNLDINHRIIQDFLRLTKETYPFGFEKEVVDLMGIPLNKDPHGNYFFINGDDVTTMFTSHLDTVSIKTKVNHIIHQDIIKTDGFSILGADDKAGVTLMIYMILKNVKGIYYFFIGEECGRIGSKLLAENFHKREELRNINKVISFDRKGVDSIITHQLGVRCASDLFANALAKSLNNNESTFKYKKDPTGVYTDSYSFVELINECTNISVGYNYQHSNQEYQSISHLIKLGEALCKIDWENLPVKRKIKNRIKYVI